jgi:hypothetical protein
VNEEALAHLGLLRQNKQTNKETDFKNNFHCPQVHQATKYWS